MRVAIMLAMLAAVPAQAADQFDLVCDLSSVTTSQGSEPGLSTMRFRVDAAKGYYCVGTCDKPLPIERISYSEITFVSIRDDSVLFEQKVDRQSGAFTGLARVAHNGKLTEEKTSGLCKLAPFTGLPKMKF